MRRLVLMLALVVLVGLAVAPAASAHTLSLDRARNKALDYSFFLCQQNRNCNRATAGPCFRVNPHRVRCRTARHGSNRNGQWVCRNSAVVKIARGSRKPFIADTTRSTCHYK